MNLQESEVIATQGMRMKMREVRIASSPECKPTVAEGAELQKTWRSLANQNIFVLDSAIV
jgi:hypothetical protein